MHGGWVSYAVVGGISAGILTHNFVSYSPDDFMTYAGMLFCNGVIYGSVGFLTTLLDCDPTILLFCKRVVTCMNPALLTIYLWESTIGPRAFLWGYALASAVPPLLFLLGKERRDFLNFVVIFDVISGVVAGLKALNLYGAFASLMYAINFFETEIEEEDERYEKSNENYCLTVAIIISGFAVEYLQMY